MSHDQLAVILAGCLVLVLFGIIIGMSRGVFDVEVPVVETRVEYVTSTIEIPVITERVVRIEIPVITERVMRVEIPVPFEVVREVIIEKRVPISTSGAPRLCLPASAWVISPEFYPWFNGQSRPDLWNVVVTLYGIFCGENITFEVVELIPTEVWDNAVKGGKVDAVLAELQARALKFIEEQGITEGPGGSIRKEGSIDRSP
jgi:hypothetical protein